MPILVKDYTWTQSDKMLNIKVTLSPVAHEKVDLFNTDSYIKASYNPFLLEIFLLHEINSEKSSCVVKEDAIILDLVKKEEFIWETLEKDLTNAEKLKLKKENLEKCQEKAKEKSEERRIKKLELDRFAVQQAMEIDTQQHTLMDTRRNEERNKAMDALEEWRVNVTENNNGKPKNAKHQVVQSISKGPGVQITELSSSDDEETKDASEKMQKIELTENSSHTLSKDACEETESTKVTTEKKPENEKKQVDIKPRWEPPKTRTPPPRKPVKTPVRSQYVEKEKQKIKKRVLPKLRETVQLEITHTPRTFPTPSRESTAHEEQVWLKNITMARRATGFVSEDLRPEEQDPQWCKEKGDEFFKAGNFLGAISAYSHGILLSDKLPSLFANRSAVHFALGNFNKCCNDCQSALDLLVPACEGNRKSRAKCLARRAAALARLGYLSKGIDEMKAAAKLLPEDETIKKDIHDMERAWEQEPDSE